MTKILIKKWCRLVHLLINCQKLHPFRESDYHMEQNTFVCRFLNVFIVKEYIFLP